MRTPTLGGHIDDVVGGTTAVTARCGIGCLKVGCGLEIVRLGTEVRGILQGVNDTLRATPKARVHWRSD